MSVPSISLEGTSYLLQVVFVGYTTFGLLPIQLKSVGTFIFCVSSDPLTSIDNHESFFKVCTLDKARSCDYENLETQRWWSIACNSIAKHSYMCVNKETGMHFLKQNIYVMV